MSKEDCWKRYFEKHKDEIRARIREYDKNRRPPRSQEQSEKRKVSRITYNSLHREALIEYQRQLRLWKKGLAEKPVFKELREKYSTLSFGICVYCGDSCTHSSCKLCTSLLNKVAYHTRAENFEKYVEAVEKWNNQLKKKYAKHVE